MENQLAKDAEGNLIEFYRIRQVDGKSYNLNGQTEHVQIDYSNGNINQYLNFIERNFENQSYLEIHHFKMDFKI